jgi:hypothetical protein
MLVISSDGKVLFCQACGKFIVTQQHSQVTKHLSGSNNIAATAHCQVIQTTFSDY